MPGLVPVLPSGGPAVMKRHLVSTALAVATILFVLGVGVWRSY
ncbi:hypothetical protein [Streptomyces lydicus]